ncbi:hypothetical protein FNV43_RR03649 [Rhamnella rubrinervis]|uniref:Uncharacterized protein n=1 Tax=Rhamnella rubrinervis TaxID=2594499 RepID=A0A8K0HK73_9ROSA|nr:hypothetical protein FNV43_RR03649 [Rhamnella rubrinervis]
MRRTAEKSRDDGRSGRAINQTSDHGKMATVLGVASGYQSSDLSPTDKRPERELGIEIHQGIEVLSSLRRIDRLGSRELTIGTTKCKTHPLLATSPRSIPGVFHAKIFSMRWNSRSGDHIIHFKRLWSDLHPAMDRAECVRYRLHGPKETRNLLRTSKARASSGRRDAPICNETKRGELDLLISERASIRARENEATEYSRECRAVRSDMRHPERTYRDRGKREEPSRRDEWKAPVD